MLQEGSRTRRSTRPLKSPSPSAFMFGLVLGCLVAFTVELHQLPSQEILPSDVPVVHVQSVGTKETLSIAATVPSLFVSEVRDAATKLSAVATGAPEPNPMRVPPNRTMTFSTQKVKKRPIPGITFKQNFSEAFLHSTKPWSNVTTLAYFQRNFHSGYRNQIMALTSLVMWARKLNHSQVLLESLMHKDTYGSERMLPFAYLFDVEHWNNYYPALPRLVRCENFTDFSCQTRRWEKWIKTIHDAKNPMARGETHGTLFTNYLRYAKGKGPLVGDDPDHTRNPVEIAMLGGALRPHPEIRAWMKRILDEKTGAQPYFALHARIEPDMQNHPMCPKQKVLNLTDIFRMIEVAFPTPPASRLFLPVNRETLEDGAKVTEKKWKTNWIAVHNLDVLNQAVKNGLWNGTVRVFEIGSGSLKGSKFFKTPSTIGALLNFEIAIHAEVFIGTPVSTWSNDVVGSRFYRNRTSDERRRRLQNYRYLPSGIETWTTYETNSPPSFQC